MRLDSSSPPDFGTSMCTPSQPCSSISLRKPCRVYRFSPVQIGTGDCLRTNAMASGFSGGTGSSSHMGRTFSRALARSMASRVSKRQWTSMANSPSGSQFLAHNFHETDDLTDIAGFQLACIGIVTGFLILRVKGARNAVALKLERGPAPPLRARLVHQVAPRGGVFDVLLGKLHGAIEAHTVAEAAAQQVHRGRFQDASGEVPQGDFHAAGGLYGDAADGARAPIAHQDFGVQLVHV